MIEKIYGTYKDHAHFYVIYIRERHPSEKETAPVIRKEKVSITDPRTLAERREVAAEFAAQFNVSIPVRVDTLDDQVERAYAAMPDRIYVISAAGKIAYKGNPGPGGFQPLAIPPLLDKLAGVALAKAFPPEPRGGPGVPGGMRARLAGQLKHLGFKDGETDQVLQALNERLKAYGKVLEARRQLMAAVGGGGDAPAALNRFEEAQDQYQKEVARIDRELDEAVCYSRSARRRAALTAFGLLGVMPGPPLAGGYMPPQRK